MSGLRKNLCQIEAIEQGRDTERQRPAPRARRRGRPRSLRFDPMLEPPEHALDVRWSAAAHPYWHSAHLPRTSITGRSAAKPVFSAAARTPPESLSSSTCTALPHVSQIRKMQSCRQPGWLFAGSEEQPSEIQSLM